MIQVRCFLHQGIMPPANTVQCSMCTLLISVDDPTTFFKHVKQKHSSSLPFHIICRHQATDCNKNYYLFVSFQRHWNKFHGNQTKFLQPIHAGNIQGQYLVKIIFYECKKLNRNVLLFYLVPLGPDDGIVDVAAPEAFDISGQTFYQ